MTGGSMYEENYESRARRERRPVPYEIFKGMGGKHGVLSVELREAYTNDKSEKAAGVVFLNMTPTIGKNQYGWKQKISLALGLADLGKVILFLRNPKASLFSEGNCSIVHDRGMNTGKPRGQDVNYLSIGKPDGATSFWFNLEEKRDGNSFSKISVPVNQDEALILVLLLEEAVSAILSWSPPAKPIID